MDNQNHRQRAEQLTVFGPGCHIKGEVSIEGDAAVLGSVEGPMQVTGELEIAEEGGVRGEVIAGNVTLNGRVEGDLHCEGSLVLNGRVEGEVMCGRIELGATSTLVGRLRAKTIAVSEGAIYRGEVIIGPDALDEPLEAHVDQPDEAVEVDVARSNGNGHHPQEVRTTSAARSAVSGLLRKRHELLNK